jgi:hypothetical protein
VALSFEAFRPYFTAFKHSQRSQLLGEVFKFAVFTLFLFLCEREALLPNENAAAPQFIVLFFLCIAFSFSRPNFGGANSTKSAINFQEKERVHISSESELPTTKKRAKSRSMCARLRNARN